MAIGMIDKLWFPVRSGRLAYLIMTWIMALTLVCVPLMRETRGQGTNCALEIAAMYSETLRNSTAAPITPVIVGRTVA